MHSLVQYAEQLACLKPQFLSHHLIRVQGKGELLLNVEVFEQIAVIADFIDIQPKRAFVLYFQNKLFGKNPLLLYLQDIGSVSTMTEQQPPLQGKIAENTEFTGEMRSDCFVKKTMDSRNGGEVRLKAENILAVNPQIFSIRDSRSPVWAQIVNFTARCFAPASVSRSRAPWPRMSPSTPALNYRESAASGRVPHGIH